MDVVDLDKGQFEGQLVRPKEYLYLYLTSIKGYILLPSKCFFINFMVVSFNIDF